MWPRMDSRANILEQANAKLTEYLTQNQMRKTPERYEILRIAVQTKGLFTVDKMAEIMSQEASFQVSRATIFNVLELLNNAQIIVKHTLGRAAQYECHMDKRPLICLICEQCGKTEKMEKQELEKTLSAIKSRKMSIRTQILYLSGTCRKCEAALRKKKKGNGRLKSDAKPQ